MFSSQLDSADSKSVLSLSLDGVLVELLHAQDDQIGH